MHVPRPRLASPQAIVHTFYQARVIMQGLKFKGAVRGARWWARRHRGAPRSVAVTLLVRPRACTTLVAGTYC